MNFCEKCGLKLEEDSPDCINCRNISLVDKEKTSIASTNNEGKNITNLKLNPQIKTSAGDSGPEKGELFNMAKLCVIKGGTEGREFPVNNEISNIGRWDPSLQSHPEIDLSDEDIDAKVSRLHARIIKKPEGYYIEDIGSRNGTFLNREFRLVQGIEYSLKDEDEVIIGHIFFKFKIS